MRKFILALIVICFFAPHINACDFIGNFDIKPVDDTPKEYTITFNTLSKDSNIDSITAKAGDPIQEPAPPVREGFLFDGWYTQNGEPFEFDVMPAQNIMLVARWIKLYLINFDTAGGSQVDPIRYAPGDKVTFPDAPNRPYYVFSGWSLDGTPVNTDEFYMPERDITLTAIWVSGGITITFVTENDATQVAPITNFAGAPISEPAPPTRPGYTFIGWYYQGNNSQYTNQRYYRYKFTVMPSQDLTLLAKWMKNVNVPTVNIDLYDKSGNPVRIGQVITHRGQFGFQQSNYNQDYFNCSVYFANMSDGLSIVEDGEIRGRGNYGSWDTMFGEDKKLGYKLKLSAKHSLMGLPASKHWTLHAGNEKIEHLFETYSALKIGREVLDGIDFTSAGFYIVLYFNGEYHGVYTVYEQIRVAKGRVDIEADYWDNDSGYMVELDGYANRPIRLNGVTINPKEGVDYITINHGWRSAMYSIEAPDPDDYAEEGMTEAQYRERVAAIKQHLTDALAPLNDINGQGKWQEFLNKCDLASFVDTYILHELYMNNDTGWGSFYLYKPDGAGAKLECVAPWDFGYQDSGNKLKTATNSSTYFYRLWQNTQFREAVRARWQVVAPQIIELLNNELGSSFVEKYKGIMAEDVRGEASANWPSQVNNKRNRLLNRINWLTTSGFNV